MKKLVIDIDEVICENGFLNLANKYLNKDYKITDFKDYIIDPIVGDIKEQESFIQYVLKENIYENVNHIDGAYKTIKKLNEIYDVYICSAFVMHNNTVDSGIMLKQKYDWLLKEFSFLNPNNYIFTNNKKIIKCDIQIDDKVSNFSNDCNLKLLFSAYHNLNIKDSELKEKNILRVNSWEEIFNILKI